MKATNKILVGLAALASIAIGAGLAVNIKGAIVDASTGYTFNGSAPNNHVLCGTVYVDATACGTVASPNYQTMQSNGTPLTARADLNFTPRFFLTDTPPSTTVDLASLSSSGTYLNPSQIVVDGFGRVTSATANSRTCFSGCYLILGDGTTLEWGSVGGCGSGANNCTVAVTFPIAFGSTTNLTVTTTVTNGAANIVSSVSGTPSTTGFTLQYGALVFVGGSGSNLSGSQGAEWHAIGTQ